MKRVLVVGGTGGTGRELIAEALARGLEVTALVRSPARLEDLGPRITVITGDVRDETAIDAAMRGQDAVVSALGHRRYHDPRGVLSRGTASILRGMERHDVPRFIGVTSLGIGDSAGRLGLGYSLIVIPLVLPIYFSDKARQERVIAASDRDWVIVRPGLLTGGARRGRIRHPHGAVDYVVSPRIPRADVAAFMLDQLASDAHLGTAVGVT